MLSELSPSDYIWFYPWFSGLWTISSELLRQSLHSCDSDFLKLSSCDFTETSTDPIIYVPVLVTSYGFKSCSLKRNTVCSTWLRQGFPAGSWQWHTTANFSAVTLPPRLHKAKSWWGWSDWEHVHHHGQLEPSWHSSSFAQKGKPHHPLTLVGPGHI